MWSDYWFLLDLVWEKLSWVSSNSMAFAVLNAARHERAIPVT